MPRLALIAVTLFALGAASCGDPRTACDDPIIVTLHANDRATLDGQITDVDGIVTALVARKGANAACRVMVRADKDVGYEGVRKLMNALQSAGCAKVALITEEAIAP